MRVSLVSLDVELFDLCREVIGELLQCEWTLNVTSVRELPAAYDLCIWDFEPGEIVGLAKALQQQDLRKHLLLTQRDHLDTLRGEMDTSDIKILLKPVTRSVLRAFVGEVCLRWREQQAQHGAAICEVRAERDEMLQCLIQANLRLQEYDQERTNLLARAVHDFRAPLTALSGYCGLLLGEQLGSITQEQGEVLERMKRSAKRLSGMADAMFQLSIARKVENRPNLQKGDIRECIDQALHEIAPFADEKRITISVNITCPPDTLMFETAQVEQLLINLLDNACKFTPRAGVIEIRGYPFFWERRMGPVDFARPVDRRLAQLNYPNAFRLDIRDSGPGIPAAHLEKIFEEYTSYSGGQDRSGGGLGLAICRMIVNQHKGRVWAESAPAGATFSFVLPLQRPESHVPGEIHSSEPVSTGGVG